MSQTTLELPSLPEKRLPRLSMTGPHVGKIVDHTKTTTLRRERYRAGWYRLYIGGKEPSIEVQLLPVRYPLFYLHHGIEAEEVRDEVPDRPFYLNEVSDAGIKRLVREEGYRSYEHFQRAVTLIRGGTEFLECKVPYFLHRIRDWGNARG